MRTSVSAFVVLASAWPALAAAGVTIDHKKVDCIVAGKHPRMNACFAPGPQGSKPRVYFRPGDVKPWYYVEMKSNSPCHEGVLPKPSKTLVGKHVIYYVEAADRDSRTLEYDTVVVRREQECKKDVVAPWYGNAPVAVFPTAPAGFVAAATIPTAVLVGAGVVTVVGAGTVVAVTGGGDTPTVATTIPPGATTPPQTTPPPTIPPTVPAPSGDPLRLACNANPRNGQAPLRVDFQAFPTGGAGVYDFFWRFGDGGTSTQVSPAYVYAGSGNFVANVQVTSGTQVASCDRSITVTAPPPPPPPTTPTTTPGAFTLTVTLSGTGTGTVTSTPAGITCTPDCTEPYAPGTVVNLTAAPTGGSTFAGWSGGGCSGTGACAVTMNAAQTVNAQFNGPPSTFLLTVNLAGTGTGGVTSSPPGINCGVDCTEIYGAGTPVSLTATPTGGSTFAGWSGGGCSGTGGCTVTMNAAQTVTATFNPPGCTALLTVTKSGTGFGVVTGPGISCLGGSCNNTFACGTPVTLTAAPNNGSAFVTWTGAGCSGSGPCNFTITGNTTVNAKFDLVFTLTVHVLGVFGGTGTISSGPPGINCAATPPPPNVCSATFLSPNVVTLTGSPGPGTNPVQWAGDCASTPPGQPCAITMNQDHSVDASFVLGIAPLPPGASPTLRWISELRSPEASGQVFLNGGAVAAVRAGRTEMPATPRPEVNHVEAVLTEGREPGTWRFELPAGITPGSLKPLAGEVVLATPDALVFRIQGRPGERVAFTFAVKRE